MNRQFIEDMEVWIKAMIANATSNSDCSDALHERNCKEAVLSHCATLNNDRPQPGLDYQLRPGDIDPDDIVCIVSPCENFILSCENGKTWILKDRPGMALRFRRCNALPMLDHLQQATKIDFRLVRVTDLFK